MLYNAVWLFVLSQVPLLNFLAVVGALESADVAVTKVRFSLDFIDNYILVIYIWHYRDEWSLSTRRDDIYTYHGPYSSWFWWGQSPDLREFPLSCDALQNLEFYAFPGYLESIFHYQHPKKFYIYKSNIVFCQITAVPKLKAQTLGQCTSQKMQ